MNCLVIEVLVRLSKNGECLYIGIKISSLLLIVVCYECYCFGKILSQVC